MRWAPTPKRDETRWIGALVGLVAGVVALSIPGLGMLIAAGPLAGAIGGLGVGAAVGGLIGLLRDHGVSEVGSRVLRRRR